MSVPIFEVTPSQVTDLCQRGRLVGCCDSEVGVWITVWYEPRYYRYKGQLPYVHAKAFHSEEIAWAKLETVGMWATCMEIWHVVPEQVDSHTDYVADYDDVSTLVMHWVPALNQHVAVMVERNGVYLPTDWQCLQPKTLGEVKYYDFIPCAEFSDFLSYDYAKVIDACVNAGVTVNV